jgi:hypothetical protein
MSKCPICGQPFRDRYDKTRPTYGRWVHRRCSPAESQRIQSLRTSVDNARDWLPLDIPGFKKYLKPPQLPRVAVRPAGRDFSYPTGQIYRLLARNDQQGFRAVLRSMERMLERQTHDERRARRTRHLNFRGFSQADASPAEKLMVEYRREGYSPWLHYRMSKMLLRYINTQLPIIMNLGARRTGHMAITNPRAEENRRKHFW